MHDARSHERPDEPRIAHEMDEPAFAAPPREAGLAGSGRLRGPLTIAMLMVNTLKSASSSRSFVAG